MYCALFNEVIMDYTAFSFVVKTRTYLTLDRALFWCINTTHTLYLRWSSGNQFKYT